MAARKKKDGQVDEILQVLQHSYGVKHPKAQIDVYRYNPASIRVRIIDPDFKGLDRVQRDELVWPLVQTLPPEILSELTVLLCITPQERQTSYMSMEFDHPTPSRL